MGLERQADSYSRRGAPSSMPVHPRGRYQRWTRADRNVGVKKRCEWRRRNNTLGRKVAWRSGRRIGSQDGWLRRKRNLWIRSALQPAGEQMIVIRLLKEESMWRKKVTLSKDARDGRTRWQRRCRGQTRMLEWMRNNEI